MFWVNRTNSSIRFIHFTQANQTLSVSIDEEWFRKYSEKWMFWLPFGIFGRVYQLFNAWNAFHVFLVEIKTKVQSVFLTSRNAKNNLSSNEDPEWNFIEIVRCWPFVSSVIACWKLGHKFTKYFENESISLWAPNCMKFVFVGIEPPITGNKFKLKSVKEMEVGKWIFFNGELTHWLGHCM